MTPLQLESLAAFLNAIEEASNVHGCVLDDSFYVSSDGDETEDGVRTSYTVRVISSRGRFFVELP